MSDAHPYGMDQIDPELQDKVITFAGRGLFKCPKCGERALRLRRQDFEGVRTSEYPQFGWNGYFEAQCQECGFGEDRDMVVAVPDMATACALMYLHDVAGDPL